MMTKYEELQVKHGDPIGFYTDKGYVFWDHENKCEVYEGTQSKWADCGNGKPTLVNQGLDSSGAPFDEHEESYSAKWGLK